MCNAFKKRIGGDVAHVEGGERVHRKMYTRMHVVKETEPRSEERAFHELDRAPEVFAEDIIEGLLKVTGNEGATAGSRRLSGFDEFFTSTRDRNSKVKFGDKSFVTSRRQSIKHDHISSDTHK